MLTMQPITNVSQVLRPRARKEHNIQCSSPDSLNPATAILVHPSGKKATVSWTAPTGKASPTGYVVQYWMSDRFNEIKSQSTASPSVTSTTLNGLVPGALYTVRVTLLNIPYRNAMFI